jgi:protein involved in polysaccharide export with SLBB domain
MPKQEQQFMSTRRVIRILAAVILVALCSPGRTQQVVPSAPSASASAISSSLDADSANADTDADTATDADSSTASTASTTSAGSTGVNPRGSLTAAQINAVLQQKPELIVELKSLVADQLQQQGIKIQADSITDEMLFSQIATNPGLRANITVWLRARGYISSTDLDRSLSSSGTVSDDERAMTAGTFDSLSQLPGSDFSQAGDSSALGLPGTLDDRATSTGSNALGSSMTKSANTGNSLQRNITDLPQTLRMPAPYNLLALRDLYTQVPPDSTKLKRFGSEVFLNRNPPGRGGLSTSTMPVDLPVGPDYVLGTGDGLTVNLWGGISQNFTRVIDREGKIILPEAGSLVVAGLTLQQAQATIAGALKQQYHDAQVAVTVARLRTVRVYVVGDVQRPGAYDLSSLSTPLNALYAAGGPTSVGSLRIVRHYRGTQLIREVDLYDFMLHGVRMDEERLQAGDTLLIPPAGPQVAIFGMVKRPAIYELKGESTLKEVLDDAGGATVAAALDHITVERIQPNQQRETLSLGGASSGTSQSALSLIASFAVKDGDRVHVAPVLPYSERSIYVEGHVVRPGKFSFKDGMQLSDVIHTYQDLLPEPAAQGEIVRLVPPDFHPETIPFDVAEVLIGNNNLPLQPFDTIRILGRYEVDAPKVTIRGEVKRPGSYALSEGMTTAKLVSMAGGLKRDALLTNADLASYTIEDGKKIVGQRTTISLGPEAGSGQGPAPVLLKPGDVLTIHQLSGWNDIGASVLLNGEVTYPGSYGIQEGERLSSVLLRAGGLRSTAYATGAVLVRPQVKELEEKTRLELIRQIETTSASARLAPNLSGGDQTAMFQAAAQQQAQVLERLRNQPASGRLVIHISSDISSWANTPADIEMRRGDVLTIPKRPGFVLVSGQVYNASAITYVPGKNAGWYLRRAGGANEVANRKEIFVIRANGSVVGRRSGGWYGPDVLSTRLDPGDVVVVPEKIIGGSLFWKNLLTIAQLSSSIAITAAVAGLI